MFLCELCVSVVLILNLSKDYHRGHRILHRKHRGFSGIAAKNYGEDAINFHVKAQRMRIAENSLCVFVNSAPLREKKIFSCCCEQLRKRHAGDARPAFMHHFVWIVPGGDTHGMLQARTQPEGNQA